MQHTRTTDPQGTSNQQPTLGSRGTRVISFYIQKGGVGKTTTAETVATVLASLKRKVLLIDTDRQASASNMLNLQPIPESMRHSMTDVIKDGVPLREAMYQAKENLWMIPSDTSINAASDYIVKRDAHDIMVNRLAELEATMAPPPLRHRPNQLPPVIHTKDLRLPGLVPPERILDRPDFLDYILIDHAPNPMALGNSCLWISHEIWAPVTLEPLAVQGLLQMRQTVKELFEKDPMQEPELKGIIPSRVTHGPEHTTVALINLYAAFPGQVTRSVHNSSEIPSAQGEEPPLTVFEFARSSRASKELVEIALQVDGYTGTFAGSPECNYCARIRAHVAETQGVRQ